MADEKFKPVERLNFYDAKSRNNRNSALIFIFIFLVLLGVLYVFSLIFSYYFTGTFGVSFGFILFILLPLSLIIIVIEAVPAYYFGDRLVIKSVGAYKPDDRKHIYLLNIVQGLSIAAGIPRPQVYIIPSKDINAFATGRNPDHATIAVTEGALEKLDRKELEGVIGHEMSHIKNYDIRYTLIVAAVVGLVAIISEMFLRTLLYSNIRSSGSNDRNNKGGAMILVLIIVGVILAIVAPIVVRLAQLAVSRQREYLADASGVEITRNPSGLMGALQKIKSGNEKNMQVSEAVSHLFFDDPKNSFMDNIFETHPKIDDRINRLKGMGG